MSSDLLSAADVQALLDVDASTIYRMAADGRLPAVKIGRQWRFPAHRIEAVLERGVPVTPRPEDLGPEEANVSASPASVETMSSLLEVVAELLGVMMVVTDMRGVPVMPVANPTPWFTEHADDGLLNECIADWRSLANDPNFEPTFRSVGHPFLCARAFIRSGSQLVGMVLAGGVAGPDASPDDDGLYHLDPDERARVLAVLPRLAASLSQLCGHTARSDRNHRDLPATTSTRRN